MSMEGTLALLTALAGEVISPMRDFELAVAVSAVREQAAADAAAATAAINAANAAKAAKAAAAADSASREVLAASIRGWDLERAALTAAREAAATKLVGGRKGIRSSCPSCLNQARALGGVMLEG